MVRMYFMRTWSRPVVGKKIWDLRRKAALTQQELAAKVGVKSASISRWEKGLIMPAPENIKSLARVFGVDEDYFSEPMTEDQVRWKSEARTESLESLRTLRASLAEDNPSKFSDFQISYFYLANEKIRLEARIKELEAQIATMKSLPPALAAFGARLSTLDDKKLHALLHAMEVTLSSLETVEDDHLEQDHERKPPRRVR